MDPNENLDETRDLADELVKSLEEEDHTYTIEDADKTMQLAENTQALDTFIMSGGFLPEEWAKRCNGGLLKRADLAREVYTQAFEATETFVGEIGTQMAYLQGAILMDKKITLYMGDAEQQEVYDLLTDIFPANHAVWEYIAKEERVDQTG